MRSVHMDKDILVLSELFFIEMQKRFERNTERMASAALVMSNIRAAAAAGAASTRIVGIDNKIFSFIPCSHVHVPPLNRVGVAVDLLSG